MKNKEKKIKICLSILFYMGLGLAIYGLCVSDNDIWASGMILGIVCKQLTQDISIQTLKDAAGIK